MRSRSPARLAAPAALVAAAIALFAVVASPSGEETADPAAPPAPTATATTKPAKKDKPSDGAGETYTVEPGDTPSGIAAKIGVEVDELLAANPDVDVNALTVGEELALP